MSLYFAVLVAYDTVTSIEQVARDSKRSLLTCVLFYRLQELTHKTCLILATEDTTQYKSSKEEVFLTTYIFRINL